MEQNEIIKLIPPILADKLQEQKLSLVADENGCRLVPTDSLLLIENGKVSGFLAKQILDIKDAVDRLGGKDVSA
jgi:hypothetical protein